MKYLKYFEYDMLHCDGAPELIEKLDELIGIWEPIGGPAVRGGYDTLLCEQWHEYHQLIGRIKRIDEDPAET
jgi:hypothetical protein